VSLDESATDKSEGQAVVTDGQRIEVAARPDDAEAEAEDWDKSLVSSFVCPYGKDPLICKGDYDVDTHGPLFESLRKLQVRRYRRNVLRSYFMRKKHGKGKTLFTIAVSGKGRKRSVRFLTGSSHL